MSSIRNECYRLNRRHARQTDRDDEVIELAMAVGDGTVPTDPYTGVDEASVVRDAFRSLPPRFQAILWSTEVEDLPRQELSRRFRTTPQAVSMLATRARQALGTAYLTRQLAIESASGEVDPRCHEVRPELAGVVRGAASRRRRRGIEEHLASCAPCRRAYDHLGSLNHHLRALPVVPALAVSGASVVSTPMTASITAQLASWWSGATPIAATSFAALGAAIVPAAPLTDRAEPPLAITVEVPTPHTSDDDLIVTDGRPGSAPARADHTTGPITTARRLPSAGASPATPRADVAETDRAATTGTAAGTGQPVRHASPPSDAADDGARPYQPAPADASMTAPGTGRAEQTSAATGSGPTGLSPAPGKGAGTVPDPDGAAALPGQSGSAPGRADAAPGSSGSAPAHDGAPTPGSSESVPGRADTAPDSSGSAPGRQRAAGGDTASAPGRSLTAADPAVPADASGDALASSGVGDIAAPVDDVLVP
jgi:hypothetical protein